MDLAQKLLAVPERENAGARSSNRFSFQQVWAFDYMLKILAKLYALDTIGGAIKVEYSTGAGTEELLLPKAE